MFSLLFIHLAGFPFKLFIETRQFRFCFSELRGFCTPIILLIMYDYTEVLGQNWNCYNGCEVALYIFCTIVVALFVCFYLFVCLVVCLFA